MLASEIELTALRRRFVAASKEIAKDLSLLAGRIEEEPTEVRASQQAATKEITAAQERLRLEADQLEGPLDLRVAVMRTVLDAQQAAQQHLDVIIKRHRPSNLLRANLNERLANMARELAASVAATSRLAETRPVQLPTNSRRPDVQDAHIKSSAVEARSSTSDLRSNPSSSHDDGRQEKPSPPMPLAAIIKAGASFALPLGVASAGLVLFFFYVNLPSLRPHREAAAEQSLRESSGRGLTQRREGDVHDVAALSLPPTNASTAASAAPVSTMSIMAAANVDVSATRSSRSDPLPPHPSASLSMRDGRQPAVSAAAVQSPATPVFASPSPTLSHDAERFVPVVSTHKDRGTALSAFAELQRRYPKLMAHRQSQLQLVDTGKNGIWYRLVVLPAASHQEASETCGRLGAAGHDRCWVKAY